MLLFLLLKVGFEFVNVLVLVNVLVGLLKLFENVFLFLILFPNLNPVSTDKLFFTNEFEVNGLFDGFFVH
jgi:hypothetical protein